MNCTTRATVYLAMVLGLLGFIGAMFLSLLPARYRDRFTPNGAPGMARAAWVSGFVQLIGALVFLIVRLYTFLGPSADQTATAMVMEYPNGRMPFAQAVSGAGLVTMANFILQPAHLLAYYFVVEGIVRILSAGVSGQPVGTLPLYIVSGIHGWITPRWRERQMGERVADEVFFGDDGKTHELKILSCRPKPDWHRHITVRYQDTFYQMFKEETGPPPRPFIYYLRKPPLGHLIVVIRDYSPTDILKKN